MGALIAPTMPAFYARPTSIDEIVTRALDQFGLNLQDVPTWAVHFA